MAGRSVAQRWTYDLSRVLARLVGVIVFHIRCQGRCHVPAEGAALVCANHQSFLDPVLVGLACDRRLTYLARQSLFRWAPFRRLILWYDTIPIQHDGLGIGGVKETIRRLRRGQMVLVFPEGTRSRDGKIAELQPGICALARRGRAPLVPVGIDGAYDAWPRWRRFPRRAVIHIQLGPPIAEPLMQQLSDKDLVEELARRIRACHAAARLGRLRAEGRST
jgi:1-acyl-sn-glycerol-3-phosphate acyltransferase